jgi:LmbE family N-acetylglucosaminyl deacetylase
LPTLAVHAVHQPPAARILWMGAHPDDETLVAPILGPACARLNAVCTLLVFTRGERGGCAIPSGCGPDLGSVRAGEMQQAATELHSQLTLWSLSDVLSNVIETWSSEAGSRDALLERIRAVIAAANPAVLYTFDPRHGSTCHPAHRAVGALVLEALGQPSMVAPRVMLLETAVQFLENGFAFSAATPDAVSIDAQSTWNYLVHNTEIHASQFTPQQTDFLRHIAAEQKRVYVVGVERYDDVSPVFKCEGN